ncbi:DUF4340 domain-containing protein [Methylococcus sp. EFPC2]|uniref:DUF4340 domain-containing protein n=1 Tax=Methylococcus sp. EFPC2 TaxID=2812648 RepID=UPI001966F730|nr:DUF4340 domain-containing protein [Methylococcus sp. EFPC2]QSA96462.1 DUF4340 domain-containing protein [Methylococcus sp. EFPC2]
MQKKLWLNLIMLAMIAGLVALAWLEPGKEESKTHTLGEMDENAADRIVLKAKDTLVFEKREGRWWLSAPFAAPANEIRVRQLLDIAKSESEAQYPLNPDDLAKYELDKPKAELTVGSLHLIFGGYEPIDMRRYVAVGNTLSLVNDDFSHHLSAPATDFVEKKLLPDEAAQPNELFLPGLKASKGQDGKWSFEPPSDAAEGITDLLSAWSQARAIDVKRLDKPAQGDIIRIGFADHAPIEFVILQREPDLILARSDWGLQYQVAGESAKSLLSLQKPQPSPKEDEEDSDETGGNFTDEDLDHEDEDMEALDPQNQGKPPVPEPEKGKK